MRAWTLLLALPLALGPGPASQGAAGAAYERAVDRALERAQADLEARLVLWQDHSTWENAWRVATEHYEVRTVHSYALGLRIAQGLETMLGHFRELLQTDFEPRRKLPIWVFPDVGAYNNFGNAEVDADEHSSFWGSFYARNHPERPVAAVYSDNLLHLEMLVTHSAVHQFLDHAFGGGEPLWIGEGLAAYFTSFWAFDFYKEEFYELVDQGRYVPVAQLVGAPMAQYTGQPHERFVELGMLFYYLLYRREDTRLRGEGEPPAPASFRDYLVAQLKGADASSLPFHARFLTNGSGIDEDFRNHQFD